MKGLNLRLHRQVQWIFQAAHSMVETQGVSQTTPRRAESPEASRAWHICENRSKPHIPQTGEQVYVGAFECLGWYFFLLADRHRQIVLSVQRWYGKRIRPHMSVWLECKYIHICPGLAVALSMSSNGMTMAGILLKARSQEKTQS